MATDKAMQLARQQEVDLVEVAPNADPPVARLLDYGKLRYLHSKKVKESRKSGRTSSLREVRFRPNIGVHDLAAKTRKVKQLLDEGAKVRVAVFFRGREVTHPELGMALLKQVADVMKDEARLERAPAMEGRSLTITLVPLANRGAKTIIEAKDAQT